MNGDLPGFVEVLARGPSGRTSSSAPLGWWLVKSEVPRGDAAARTPKIAITTTVVTSVAIWMRRFMAALRQEFVMRSSSRAGLARAPTQRPRPAVVVSHRAGRDAREGRYRSCLVLLDMSCAQFRRGAPHRGLSMHRSRRGVPRNVADRRSARFTSACNSRSKNLVSDPRSRGIARAPRRAPDPGDSW